MINQGHPNPLFDFRQLSEIRLQLLNPRRLPTLQWQLQLLIFSQYPLDSDLKNSRLTTSAPESGIALKVNLDLFF